MFRIRPDAPHVESLESIFYATGLDKHEKGSSEAQRAREGRSGMKGIEHGENWEKFNETRYYFNARMPVCSICSICSFICFLLLSFPFHFHFYYIHVFLLSFALLFYISNYLFLFFCDEGTFRGRNKSRAWKSFYVPTFFLVGPCGYSAMGFLFIYFSLFLL